VETPVVEQSYHKHSLQEEESNQITSVETSYYDGRCDRARYGPGGLRPKRDASAHRAPPAAATEPPAEEPTEPLGLNVTGFEEVVALDRITVQITVSEPTALMLTARLHYAWILPRSVWVGVTYDEIMEFEDIAAVIGTGPYKLAEYVEDEYMIMEANEDYYRGKPVIDRIIIQQLATEDAMVQALLAGEVDLIDKVLYTAVQPLQDAENVEVVIMPSLGLNDLVFNSHVDGTQPDSLNDPAVRLAMDYAIDKQEIIDVAYAGYAEVAASILTGETPNPIDLPPGCRFHPRCPAVSGQCSQTEPQLQGVGADHQVACMSVQVNSGYADRGRPISSPCKQPEEAQLQ